MKFKELSFIYAPPKTRVGQFGLPFVKYPQSDADACYNLESNSELVKTWFCLKNLGCNKGQVQGLESSSGLFRLGVCIQN